MSKAVTKKQIIILSLSVATLVGGGIYAFYPFGSATQQPTTSVDSNISTASVAKKTGTVAALPLDDTNQTNNNDLNSKSITTDDLKESDVDEVFATFSNKAQKVDCSKNISDKAPIVPTPPLFNSADLNGGRTVLPRNTNYTVGTGMAQSPMHYQEKVPTPVVEKKVKFCENGECGYITDSGFIEQK
jgi:hypothetical protein